MWNSRAKQQQLFEMHLIRILIRPKQAELSFAMGAGKKFKFNDIQISAKIINLVMAVRSVARESSNLYVNWICSRNQRRGESESASASPCDALKFY